MIQIHTSPQFVFGFSIQATKNPSHCRNIYIGFLFWEIIICIIKNVKE